jgi:branched-chain amino acid transport system substrate-binding protein
MRSDWRGVALASLAALCVVGAGCGDDEEDAGNAGTTGGQTQAANPANCQATIGLMAPITGDAASIGEQQRNWFRLAVKRFNQEHGTRFEGEEGDTQLDPGQASTVAQRFVSDEAIKAVVGPAGSQEVQAVGPVFTRGDLGFISPSATRTDLTTGGDYPTFARVVPNDDVQVPTDARFITEELKARRVLIVDDQTSYSTGLAEGMERALREANVQVSRESVRQEQTDFSALASKVPDDVDVVFLPWQLAASAQQFGRQLDEQGKDTTIFGTDGLYSPEEFTIAGSYVSSFAPDIASVPESRGIAEAYRQQYGGITTTFGPPTYVATRVALTAAQAACRQGENPSREQVAEQLRRVNLAETILGYPIAFDQNGDARNTQFFIFRVGQDGKYEAVNQPQ